MEWWGTASRNNGQLWLNLWPRDACIGVFSFYNQICCCSIVCRRLATRYDTTSTVMSIERVSSTWPTACFCVCLFSFTLFVFGWFRFAGTGKLLQGIDQIIEVISLSIWSRASAHFIILLEWLLNDSTMINDSLNGRSSHMEWIKWLFKVNVAVVLVEQCWTDNWVGTPSHDCRPTD